MDIFISHSALINPCGKMPIERETVTGIIENLLKTRIDERGRIYIPKPVRERFLIELGERLYIKIEGNHFSIYTPAAINRLQLTRNTVGEEHGF